MTPIFALLVAAALPAQVTLTATDCAVKDVHPVFEAKLDSAEGVREVRLYFRSALEREPYYVQMTPDDPDDRTLYMGRLPKPKLEARTLTLHAEAMTVEGGGIRSESSKVRVIGARKECRDNGVIAGVGREREVDIVTTATRMDKPAGFKGVGKVVRIGQAPVVRRVDDRRPVTGAAKAGSAVDKKAKAAEKKAREAAKKDQERKAKEEKARREAQAKRDAQARKQPQRTARAAPRSTTPMPPARVPDVQGTQPAARIPARATSPAPVAPPAAVESPTLGASATGDYLIGPEDILKVTVYGHEDLTQVVVVQPDGTFTFPLLGRVTAQGQSPDVLAAKMADLLAKGFVREPQVSVVVQEFKSKIIFVVGEVLKPGRYAIEASMTLVEILAKAAPTSNAGSEIVIVRPKGNVRGPVLPDEVAGVEGATMASSAGADVIKVNLRDIQMGRLDKNLTLVPGDTVFVTEAGKVYVLGEVRNPGAYTYKSGLTVRQAVSLAGGYTADAATGKVRVIRDTSRKAKDELKLELDAPVQAGDTVIVKAKLF